MDQDARTTIRTLVRILGAVAIGYGVLALLFEGHLSLLDPPWLRVPIFDLKDVGTNGILYVLFGLVLLAVSGKYGKGSEPH